MVDQGTALFRLHIGATGRNSWWSPELVRCAAEPLRMAAIGLPAGVREGVNPRRRLVLASEIGVIAAPRATGQSEKTRMRFSSSMKAAGFREIGRSRPGFPR